MKKPEQRRPLLPLRDARRRPPWTMSGESTFVLDSTVSPARSFALSFDPGAFDTLMDTTTLLKETFGLAMPEARGSPHAEEERRADPPTAVEEEEEEEDVIVPYERERLERMRRNDEVMRRLGITESVNKLAGKAAPRRTPSSSSMTTRTTRPKTTPTMRTKRGRRMTTRPADSTAARGAAPQGRAATIPPTAS